MAVLYIAGKEAGKELMTMDIGKKVESVSTLAKATTDISEKVISTIEKTMQAMIGETIDNISEVQ